MTRTLYGIGAGPGDPELMTLRGLRLLRESRCVFLPATRAGGSYARSIVERYLDPKWQQIIELVCPAYRDRSAITARWVELASVVCDRLSDGQSGAFVCEGDPSLYSTWVHLRHGLEQLETDVDLHVVPGITSVSAAAAAAGQPLAMWSERLLVAPAVREPAELSALLAEARTVALLKAGGGLAEIADAIEALETAVQVSTVQRVGRPEERVLRGTQAMRTVAPDYFTTILLRCAADD